METAVRPTVARPRPPSRYAELSVVRLARAVRVEDRIMPAGSSGTIVGVYADGAAYEIEFHRPFHAVVTTEAIDLL